MSDIDKIEPFLGRMIIKIVKENADEVMKKKYAETGVSSEFLNSLEIVRGSDVVDDITGQRKFKKAGTWVPYTKGKIIKKAPDTFGTIFKDRYGEDCKTPDLGDIVYFITNETYRLDPNDEYHLINDCDIVAFEKGE